MRRALVIALLLVALAVTALALNAAAQTPPPTNGDWVITDSTSISNRDVTIRGSVRVMGSGQLSLVNVNLQYGGTGTHEFSVTSNAKLTISGGSVTGGQGIYTQSWRTSVTNCTITSPASDGIRATLVGTYSRGFNIADNTITSAGGAGVYISVGNYGDTTTVRVTCVKNNVTDSASHGIHCAPDTDKGWFFLEGNHVLRAGGHGVNVNSNVRVVGLKLSDIYAKNCTLDGLHAVVSMSIPLTKSINGVTAIGNDETGVYIAYPAFHWDDPVFRNWHIEDNKVRGIYLSDMHCATLEDSYNVNDVAQSDYEVVNTVLECFRVTHRKAAARVGGTQYFVFSYRYLNFHAVWQNGQPCRFNTVEFEDNSGNRLFQYTSDIDGWMGNHTEWDWIVTSTRSRIRSQLSPFMTGGSTRLSASSFDFDRDFKEDLVFLDDQPPDLEVKSPVSNHVQSSANLTITGKCLDSHSGARLVQVSFDPEPNWHLKSWYNVTDTAVWEISFDPWPDGFYNIYVRAFDFANFPNGAYSNVTINNVTIDTDPPALNLIQPAEDIITNNTQITVLGTTDADVLSLSINGELIDYSGGTFNKQVFLNEGNNTLVLVATDYAGNIRKVTRTILLDSIQPILVVTNPPSRPDDAPHRTNRPEIALGGYTDKKDVNLTVDGVPAQISGETWTHTVSLFKGMNSITVDAVDIAKNHKIVTVKVFYDPDPPVIQVTNPSEGDVINTSRFTVEGSVDLDVANNQIIIDDIFIGVSFGIFQHEMTIVTDGPHAIHLKAIDTAGNVAEKTVNVVIDTTAPQIWNLSFADGDIVSDQSVSIQGMTEDGSLLYVDGSVTQVIGGVFTKTISLDEGRNVVSFRVSDPAGNVRVLDRILNLDTKQPGVILTEVIAGVVTTDKGFYQLVGDVDEEVDMTVSYGGITEPVTVEEDGSFSHSILIGENETTEVKITAEDYAGNVFSENITIIREMEEEPGLFEKIPGGAWSVAGIIIILVVAFPLTLFVMRAHYRSQLKRMGASTTPPPPEARGPPAGPRTGPPPRPPAPGEGGKQPPRPPRPDEGPRTPPRPPKPDEGPSPKTPPRPPKPDE